MFFSPFLICLRLMNNRPCRKGCGRGCVNRHRPAGSVLRVVAWGQGYCHLTFDIFPTKEKTDLFSDVRFIPVIADVCLSFLTAVIPSRRRNYETVSIYASFLSPGGPFCVMKPFLTAYILIISAVSCRSLHFRGHSSDGWQSDSVLPIVLIVAFPVQ